MRTIGIDLALTAAHKAVVMDDQQHYVTSVISFHTRAAELDSLLTRARQGADSPEVQVVMEPTGMAWFPIAVYLEQQQVPSYLVNCQEVSDLRKYYRRHAKSDRIDARVLAKLPSVNLREVGTICWCFGFEEGCPFTQFLDQVGDVHAVTRFDVEQVTRDLQRQWQPFKFMHQFPRFRRIVFDH